MRASKPASLSSEQKIRIVPLKPLHPNANPWVLRNLRGSAEIIIDGRPGRYWKDSLGFLQKTPYAGPGFRLRSVSCAGPAAGIGRNSWSCLTGFLISFLLFGG